GDFLAFYRMDQTMVTDYSILDLMKQPAVARNIKYPMAGAKSHEVTIGIYKLSSGKLIYLHTGLPKEQYLTNVCWSPDEKFIYVAILNRDQNEMQFNQYDVKTGNYVKTLFQEKDNEYVQPLNPMDFLKDDSGLFIWQSKRDGFNNVYLYNTDGQVQRNLTAKDPVTGFPLEVTSVYGFDKERKFLFFQAVPKDNIIRNVYKSEISNGKVSLLSREEGVNSGQFSDDGKFYLNSVSSIKAPKNIDLYNTDGQKLKNLLTADNPLKDYKMPVTEIFTIKAEDGTSLFCRLIKPIDFDPLKKYPVMVYVYGGPNIQLITNSWLGNGDMFLQYMAQKGFVVFTLDNRGTANRGIEFEQSTFRQLGTVEINDQLKGVEYLKTLTFVDKDRLGLFGWSYGGFMTTSLMTRTPGIFKAAVAGGPVIDWGYYEVMYTERYMDTPQTNPDGYKKANLFNYVSDLKGNLLMIHGTSDDVVVWQQSLLYQKAAVEKGIQLDYYVYPGHFHNVLGKDRVHLMKKVSDYLIEHL
ncbi:MAG TPA: DPP IV N-terminal domain-containing protein, partial [Saprospiraceae bacterium]|nr:DPP IV N-terminal domain-containing protein [Saprospiraceae bacterium]